MDAHVAVSSSGKFKPPSLCLEDKRQVTSIMSAQPTHEPNHKVYICRTLTDWNTRIAKQCQIYNFFQTNIRIHKKRVNINLNPTTFYAKNNYSVSGLRWHQWMNSLVKVPFVTFTPYQKNLCGTYLKNDFFK